MHNTILTVDLGFGDAGKGSIVDYLARRESAHTVVRYNGGAQAAHRVVTPEATPREHVFSQFGSGTFAGAATHLARFMLLDPLAMIAEARHLHQLGLSDVFARTTIDARALVISPFQRAINRLKELARGAGRHGSCGMGIGETAADYLAHGERVLFAGDLAQPAVLRAKLAFLRQANLAKLPALRLALPDTPQATEELTMLTDDDWGDWMVDAYHELARLVQIVPGNHLQSILKRRGTVIFEGAQGVLLDEWHGFHPYTTWSTTTLANADQLLGEAGYQGNVQRVGITRAYATRHGAGPFVSEDQWLTARLPDARNGFGAWQHGFRAGWLDLVLLRYACEVVGPLDTLAVTCLDRLAGIGPPAICQRYQCDGQLLERLVRSPHPRDLAYQEGLTTQLARCQPLLEVLPDAQAIVARLATDLGVPVGILSYGPTASDKQAL